MVISMVGCPINSFSNSAQSPRGALCFIRSVLAAAYFLAPASSSPDWGSESCKDELLVAFSCKG